MAGLVARFSQDPSVLTCYRGLLAGIRHPPTLNFSSPPNGLGFPPSSCPSLYNPTILVTWPFDLTLYLLALLVWLSPLPSPLRLSSQGLAQSGQVQSGLLEIDVLPLAMLCLLSIIDFLLHHAYKQSCLFFILFFYFSFTCCPDFAAPSQTLTF